MKKMILAVAAMLALSAPLISFAASEHGGHGGHGGDQGDVAHEEVVDGVKATFKIMSMKEHMKASGMEMPKGMKETHHIAAEFKDVKRSRTPTKVLKPRI